MDKYIQALIALNNSVILPGFGALSLTNEETGEIMFNEYLTFNDGKLESYIAEQEGIDKQDAANMISKYVRELELLLNKGETYDIFQFGRFIKKSDGSFDFENWKSFSEEGSSTYVAPVKSEETEDEKVDETKVKKAESTEKKAEEVKKDETPTESQTLKKEVISEEEIDSIKEVYEKPAERTLTEEEKKQSKNKFTPTEAADKTSEKAPEPLKENVKAETNKKKVEAKKPKEKAEKKVKSDKPKKKRSVFFIPLIIFLILIGAAGTFIGIFPDEAKKLVGWEDVSRKDQVDETPQQIDEDPATDETDDSEFIDEGDVEEYTEDDVTADIAEGLQETAKEEVIVPVQSTSGNFHIIVGSFSELQNAENLTKTLQSKGYDAKVIGPVNNLHMVSFSAYESRDAAQSNLQKAIEETGGGWILKR